MPGTIAHRCDIEWRGDLPYPPALEGWRRSPVQNAVTINPARGRQPSIKLVRDCFGAKDADRSRPQVMVEGAAEHLGFYHPRQIEMRGLCKGVHTCVGTPGPVNRNAFPAKPRDCVFDGLLDRKPIRLPLPANESAAVILDSQLVAGHESTVPEGI